MSFLHSSVSSSASSPSESSMSAELHSDKSFETISWSRWKARLVKTLLAFGFYAGNLILNALLLTIVHERVPLEVLPLPDVAFDFLPYSPKVIYFIDAYIILLHLMLLFLLIFHRTGYRICQRFCLISGFVYFVRAISMSVTQLPVSANRFECSHKMSNDITSWQFVQTILKRATLYLPSLGQKFLAIETFCGDNLYSGSTISIVIGYSFLSTYLMPAEVKAISLAWWLADFLLYTSSLVAIVLLIVARSYYLIDILIAYWISSRTFYIYHTICSHESLHYSTYGNFFTKFWWWPLFVFFEVDNPGRIAVVKRFYNPIRVLGSICSKKKSTNIISNNYSFKSEGSDQAVQ